jgi:hypothetical protein
MMKGLIFLRYSSLLNFFSLRSSVNIEIWERSYNTFWIQQKDVLGCALCYKHCYDCKFMALEMINSVAGTININHDHNETLNEVEQGAESPELVIKP